MTRFITVTSKKNEINKRLDNNDPYEVPIFCRADVLSTRPVKHLKICGLRAWQTSANKVIKLQPTATACRDVSEWFMIFVMVLTKLNKGLTGRGVIHHKDVLVKRSKFRSSVISSSFLLGQMIKV